MTTTCGKCGAVAILEEDYSGMCPGCLAGFAFEAPEELETLGKYQLTELLGSGGMGVVYRAEDPDLGRTVALKVMRPHLTEKEQERFRHEARLLAQVHHPHIVPIHDYGMERGWFYYVMEYVAAKPLSQHLSAPPRDLLRLVQEAALAIQHLHDQGVLHRDLKPANILVDGSFAPRIVDFGIAKTEDVSLTPSNALVGTPPYMSPEQARGEELDARADVYALGAVLYECLTGRPPFEGRSTAQILHRVLQEDPAPPQVDRPLVRICLKALEKDRARRYSSAAELAADLGRYLVGEAVLARGPGLRPGRWIRRHAVALLSALVLAGGGTAVYLATRPKPPLSREEDLEALIAHLGQKEKNVSQMMSRGLKAYREGDYRMAAAFFGKSGSYLENTPTEKTNLTPAQHARLRQQAHVYFALCEWRRGQVESALREARRAVEAGFRDDGTFDGDDAFRAMQSDPRFAEALRRR